MCERLTVWTLRRPAAPPRWCSSWPSWEPGNDRSPLHCPPPCRPAITRTRRYSLTVTWDGFAVQIREEFTYLEILWEAVSVVLLVEPLGVQRASHLKDLQVSLQLLGQFRSFHVEPGFSCRFCLLLLTIKNKYIQDVQTVTKSSTWIKSFLFDVLCMDLTGLHKITEYLSIIIRNINYCLINIIWYINNLSI